jgi:hypothetical protein
VASGLDFSARYLVDPTPFYLVGRSLAVAFAVGTVWLTYLIGRRLAGRFAGAVAATLLALNTYHIGRSQQIEVDVPLTFFAMLALWLAMRLIERPTWRRAALVGMAIGLATSTKYTGAILLLPLGLAWLALLLARVPGLRWWLPLLSLGAAFVVFLATSPYVLLDHEAFLRDFGQERQHMRLGHFGLGESSSLAFYGTSLTKTLLGWPAALLAAIGLVALGRRARKPESVLLVGYAVIFLLAVSMWRMHADRYLLPVLPAMLVLVAVATNAVRDPRVGRFHAGRFGPAVAAALAIAAAVPSAVDYPAYATSISKDPRTEAAAWVEVHAPSGSLIVSEQYGPELFAPQVALKLPPELAAKVKALKAGEPGYGLLLIPLFQVMPERSAVFYDLGLYANADYIVTTGAVRSRYEASPSRYGEQLEFYRQLDTAYEKIAEFPWQGNAGSAMRIYRNPSQSVPFATRTVLAPLPRVRIDSEVATGSEDLFYFEMGLACEAFGHLPEAIASYDLAFSYGTQRPAVFQNLVLRKVNCLLVQGRRQAAAVFLEAAIAHAPTATVREQLERRSANLGQ